MPGGQTIFKVRVCQNYVNFITGNRVVSRFALTIVTLLFINLLKNCKCLSRTLLIYRRVELPVTARGITLSKATRGFLHRCFAVFALQTNSVDQVLCWILKAFMVFIWINYYFIHFPSYFLEMLNCFRSLPYSCTQMKLPILKHIPKKF